VPGGETIILKTTLTVDSEAGDILIDFEGSSGPSNMGINVVPAYTHAYATFAVRSTLNPEPAEQCWQPWRLSESVA
jgi:N-methylhydantoinase B